MECIISIVILLSLMIIGILFYNGKCAFLISGYNMLDEEQKKEYDEKALLRFMSYVTFIVDILCAVAFSGTYFNLEWLSIVAAIAIIFCSVFASIYWNTGNRFKRK